MTVTEPVAPEAPAAEPAAPAPEPAAVEPAAPEAEPVEPVVEEPAVPAAGADGLEGLPESWQKEIKDLRAENAKRRTESKTWGDVLDPFDEPAQQVLVDLIRTLGTDTPAGAARMRELADLIDGVTPEPVVDPDADKPITKSDLERIQKERDDKAAEDASQEQIKREVVDLGYTLGSREHYALLWEASHKHKGDLVAAHEALEAEHAATIDKYLADKRATAAGTPIAGSDGAPPANDTPITTFEQARASVEAKAKAAGFSQ